MVMTKFHHKTSPKLVTKSKIEKKIKCEVTKHSRMGMAIMNKTMRQKKVRDAYENTNLMNIIYYYSTRCVM